MLKATNISKKIGNTDILKDVSLKVRSGEIVSIIGPSGAGKTSLLRALSLLEMPDAGSMQVDEHVYTFPVGQLKTAPLALPYPALTVVFQQLFVWPHLTVKENMLLPLRADVDENHFEEVVELFQMRDFLDRYPNEISLGQRQRTALARALLLKPQYLLLDEVTSALDVEQSYLILSHLAQIAKRGVGIVFVTHALHLAHTISDKVLFMDNGAILESGDKHILRAPQTARLRKFLSHSKIVV
jgi:ABC-type polar amino acid transport system ATPase subunit